MTRDGAGRLGETDTSEGGSETVWVSTAGSFYHTDRDCIRLKSEPNARRAEIGKAWYDPCSYCVADADTDGSARDPRHRLRQHADRRSPD